MARNSHGPLPRRRRRGIEGAHTSTPGLSNSGVQVCAPSLLPRVVVMRPVDDVCEILILRAGRFFQLLIRDFQCPRTCRPGFGQNRWIVCGGLVLDGISDTAQTLHDFEVLGVECSVIDQPGLFIEVDGFDNQGISFKVPDGIAQITCRKSIPMRTPVGGNDPEERAVNIVIKKYNLARVLYDLVRWSDARNPGSLALQERIRLHLTVA